MPTVNLTTPTDYATEAAAIDRRRKLAETLQQQSLQPMQGGQMVSGWYVPSSWTEGLAKMIQSYSGAKGAQQADEDQRALVQKLRDQGQQDVTGFMSALQGTPEKWSGESGDELYTPAVAGDRNKALAIALGSQNPVMAGAGQSMLAEMLKTPESLFGKVDPKDYTPQSIAQYAATKNPAVLVPVRKQEALTAAGANGAPVTQFYDPYNPPSAPVLQPIKQEMVNQGNQITPVNPYAPPNPMQVGVSPNTVFTQNAENARWLTPSANTLATNATTRRGQDMAADPTLQGNLAQAKAAGATTGNATAQAAMDLPAATAKAQQALGLIDQMVGSKDGKIKAHPGFETAVGATWAPGLRFVEGTDTAGFMKLLDQVKGGAFLQAFEALKGGGQITEVEGAKATAAITRMDKAQSEKEFTQAAREFQDVIRAGVQRAQQKAAPMRRASDSQPVLRFDAQGNPIQ